MQYEKVCDFQNLYRAHKKTRTCKRHKQEVIHFENNLAQNLCEIARDLENRDYRLQGYYHFTVTEPKKREIFAAYYKDRVMQRCLCDEVIKPELDKRLIYDNAACREGKGNHFAQKRLSHFLSQFYKNHGSNGYCLKCDIKSYFPSIDHAVLKQKLSKVFLEEDVLQLLFSVIDSYETEGTPQKGLPLGNQSSQWFAIYYLDSIDRLIKETLRIKYYTRYMDDFILLHPDKKVLQQALQQIRAAAHDELGLQLNQKTQLMTIQNGIDYLGFRFILTPTGKVIRKLRTSSKKRLRKRLLKLQHCYHAGKQSLEEVNMVYASYIAHLAHGHTYHLLEKTTSEIVFSRSEG